LGKDRTLSDDARGAMAKLFDIPELCQAWAALVLHVFSETDFQECERAIGLIRPNPEFRAGIADAVLVAVVLHFSAPKPPQTVRNEWANVAKQAAAAATSLEQLSAALDQTRLRDRLPESFTSLMATRGAIDLLRGLAEVAQRVADRVQGKPGRPKKVAFDAFVRQLADAFSRATERPAGLTWSDYRRRYEGRFWDLIAHVLPRAEAAAGSRLAPAKNRARGRQAQRILSAMDKTPAATA
jgi:hypothetical protein